MKCALCNRKATHKHHRKMRSQGGTDDPSNLMDVCAFCHETIHHNPLWAYDQGYLIKSWDTALEAGAEPPGAPASSVAEGQPHPSSHVGPVDTGDESAALTSLGDNAEEVAQQQRRGTRRGEQPAEILGSDGSDSPVGDAPEVCPTCGRKKPGRKKAAPSDSKPESRLTLKQIVGVGSVPAEAASVAAEAIEKAIANGDVTPESAWRLLFEFLPAEYLAGL